MPTADDYQDRHDLSGAIAIRLQALRDGSQNPREWQQTGVLLVRLVQSAYIQWEFEVFSKQEILGMLKEARWLFHKALGLLTHKDGDLLHCAILCDDGLAQALSMEYSGSYPSIQPFSELDLAMSKVLKLPDGPSRDHQRAIAYSFLARSYWHMRLSTSQYFDAARAEECEALADQLFAAWQVGPIDGNQAFRTHLMAMALIHRRYGTRGWRRKSWRAFRMARQAGDNAHAKRSLAITLFGLAGERFARAYVDKHGIINSVAAQVVDLHNADKG